MHDEHFISVIQNVLKLETLDPVANRAEIEKICLAEIHRLKQEGISVDHKLYEFLDDYDIRIRDAAYRRSQSAQVLAILERILQSDSE